jgi:hypothetical protein
LKSAKPSGNAPEDKQSPAQVSLRAETVHLSLGEPENGATGEERNNAAGLATELNGRGERSGIERPLTCEEAAELVATTRNSGYKSRSPRLPHEGPSRFLGKLDPWFVGLANLFKETVTPAVHQPKRRHTARQRGRGKHPEVSPPPAVLPEWPRTFGEMLGLLATQGDPTGEHPKRAAMLQLVHQLSHAARHLQTGYGHFVEGCSCAGVRTVKLLVADAAFLALLRGEFIIEVLLRANLVLGL